jgi:Glycosyl transferase family group 2
MLEMVIACGRVIGYLTVICASIIGVRFLLYFHSFILRWPRYRQLRPVTTADIRALPRIPYVKIQITTRGLPDSTRVIRRGVHNVVELTREAPELYAEKLSIEVVTESQEQKALLDDDFARQDFPLQAFVLLVPEEYASSHGTKLKARSLHYMIELRRRGFNRKLGRTFIVHYDEESVMEPGELRKLIQYLANTSKQLSEGPIYYPLEYGDAAMICRAMEANRPIGCFECRKVMENGTPLHLHGSNLVVDEDLENALGWDIGTLEGQPLVAEDYVFGVRAYLRFGPQIFGWHGSIMLEQPPFTLTSAFKQRYRWIIGVLQGITSMQKMAEFRLLPRKKRLHLVWATAFRIMTFALGLPTGAFSLLYLLYQMGSVVTGRNELPLPVPLMGWLFFVSFLWLNSMLIGAWYNLCADRQLSVRLRCLEGLRVMTMAPVAGVVESGAGFWAVLQWLAGNRTATWQPTPKAMPARRLLRARGSAERAQLLLYALGSALVALLYLIAPLMIVLSALFPSPWSRLLVALEIVALGELAVARILLKTTPADESLAPVDTTARQVGRRPVSASSRLSRVSLRSGAAFLALGISFQWLLLGVNSPLAINPALQGASASNQACAPAAAGAAVNAAASLKRPADYQTGVNFPQWGSAGYSLQDKEWLSGLRQIKQQTAAQWVGVSINLYQPSLTSTRVQAGPATPSPQALGEGIRVAMAMHYHVFVFPQLTVGGAHSWAGDIQFPTRLLAQAWFDSYWAAFRPYVVAAAQAGAQELAVGSEFELLQPADQALWKQLITRAHQAFPGKLTYDINWSSLYYPLPAWLHNPFLNAIGVSVYNPLTDTPRRLDPHALPALWQTTIGRSLDAFASKVGKPLLISELGYRDSADALYDPWEITTSAPADQVEQAAAYNAALSNVMNDPHIAGVFAWAWAFQPFDLQCRLAAQVLHDWYAAPSLGAVTAGDAQGRAVH